MHSRFFSLPQPAMSREKNLMLILMAILVALILWNAFWWLLRVALFVVIIYIIYLVLKRYA